MSVSVCCITYNHEKFIAKSIEGVLAQQADFPIQLIIGEDGSSDNTRKICEEYQKKFPDKIVLLPGGVNSGMMPNFIRTLKACTGDFTAICEGDDYWIDPAKLQKQADFLRNHPDYSICFHPVYELKAGKLTEPEDQKSIEKEYSILDLAKGNFISTPSVLFRNGLIPEFPEWYNASPVGDYVLHMLNARHGKIKYFPQPMAVYRRHAQGAWGLKKAEENYLKMIRVVQNLEQEFDGEVKDTLLLQEAAINSQLATIKYYERQVPEAVEYLKRAFALEPGFKERWLLEDYPNIINNLFNSRRYKTADRIAFYLSKLSIRKSYI